MRPSRPTIPTRTRIRVGPWLLDSPTTPGQLSPRHWCEPALDCAKRYDRTTGYFSATALALASRGIEGLIRNDGRMRMVVGCTLDQPEIDAIEKGSELRDVVGAHMAAGLTGATDLATTQALE